jgi:Xaa-Pro aminopeptidase
MLTRLSRLKKILKENNLDAVLISTLPNIEYLTDFTHFYDEEREAFLFITKNNQYILTDKRYTHAVKTYVKNFDLREIFYGHGFTQNMQQLADEENIKRIGIEEDNLTYAEFKKIEPVFTDVVPLDLSAFRVIKTADEIASLQKACAISDATYVHILNFVKEGITEKEIAKEMEMFITSQGAELSFPTIVAFEENGAFIHHQTSNRQLKKNDTILLDFGAKYNNYCSDVGRVCFFGKASSEKRKAYESVIAAQEKVKAFLEKKLANDETIYEAAVDKIARDFLIKQGYESYPHGLGHGMGLQVHELPHLRPPSKGIVADGMVFSNEPGVYVPGKFGIRIEDDLFIKGKKLIQLTNATRELIEIA